VPEPQIRVSIDKKQQQQIANGTNRNPNMCPSSRAADIADAVAEWSGYAADAAALGALATSETGVGGIAFGLASTGLTFVSLGASGISAGINFVNGNRTAAAFTAASAVGNFALGRFAENTLRSAFAAGRISQNAYRGYRVSTMADTELNGQLLSCR
jgi:hypothetical protein